MGMLEQRDERQQTSVPCNTKGERELLSAPPPKVAEELPAALRAQERIAFDVASYDLRGEAAKLLEDAGLKVGFGSFDGHSRELEDFAAAEAVFSSFKYERHWRQCVREAEAFLQVYERLVREVICPVLKSKLEEDTSAASTTFYYQLQPGPSEQYRRVHRDAEYGHQDGEVNFWMPLTDYSKTKVTLWVESEPDAGDFQAMDLDYGSIGMFHGTNCRHWVPGNPSPFTRVSMDFRIGVGQFFDPKWALHGIHHKHERRTFVL
eukprot:TRINITY_DN5570_c0_g1_i10.p1 TRINITY_DN5570_c0_g1~~TRINITY_DN5570_c0_g1_i10.p1  ORF type:complete len:263 (-),score=52.21 TRINITY_DN5570_c0_g1_i10:22-810(-)